MNKKSIRPLFYITTLFILLFALIGCQPSESQPSREGTTSGGQIESGRESNEDDVPSEVQGEAAGEGQTTQASADPLDTAQQNWTEGPHADTFVVDDQGKNNSCAKCHAPINWMPTMDDIPESCSACKFELEPPPPNIPEEEWTDIPCLICHQENKKGVIQAEYSWLEIPALEEYAAVNTSTELCQKCHKTDNLPNHGMVNVGGAHAEMQCTECHQAHSTATSCSSEDCHPDSSMDSTDLTPGHDQEHQEVSCVACHDGAGWEIDLDDELGYWTTYYSWEFTIKNGDDEMVVDNGVVPFSSHNIVLEVDCERCHFPDNPWGLKREIETP